MVSYPAVFPDCLRWDRQHPEYVSGQNKLPVCEEDFYTSDNGDDRRGRVKFQRVCVTFLTFVPEDVYAAVTAGHLPEWWNAAPHLREAKAGEALQQRVVAHQRVSLRYDEDHVHVDSRVHAAGERQHVRFDLALLGGGVKALNQSRWLGKKVHVVLLPSEQVNSASQIDASSSGHCRVQLAGLCPHVVLHCVVDDGIRKCVL